MLVLTGSPILFLREHRFALEEVIFRQCLQKHLPGNNC